MFEFVFFFGRLVDVVVFGVYYFFFDCCLVYLCWYVIDLCVIFGKNFYFYLRFVFDCFFW